MVAMLIPTGPGATGPGTVLAGGSQFRSAWDFIEHDLRRLRKLSGTACDTEGLQLRQALVAETARGLGPRVGSSWERPKRFSGPQPVIRAIWIRSRAPNIIFAHDQPSLTIRPSPSSRLATRGLTPRSSHRLLAIPTANAGKRGSGRFSNRPMTPGVYEQLHNVQLVRVGNVLIDPQLRTGKGGKRTRQKGAGGSGTLQGAVVFVLVPQVILKKRIDIEAVGQASANQLLDEIASEFLQGGSP